MTIQTAVLIETLTALGAEVRWASCNIFSTQDHAAAAIAADGIPVFAVKGESLADYWDYTHRIFEWADGGYSNMILDDGGDATLLLHLGPRRAGRSPCWPSPGSKKRPSCSPRSRPSWPPTRPGTRCASPPSRASPRKTTTGVHRLYQMHERGELEVPGDQRQRLGHQVQVRQPLRLPRSLVDGIKRATDVMIAGKVAVVAGYGDVGKGLGPGPARPVGPGVGHRDRPDLRAAGRDGRLPRRDHGLRRRARPTSSSPPPATTT